MSLTQKCLTSDAAVDHESDNLQDSNWLKSDGDGSTFRSSSHVWSMVLRSKVSEELCSCSWETRGA